MTSLDNLGAAALGDVVRGYRDVLRTHQAALNRLNVYPVPDGDTGTNMALTMESVCAELDELAGPAATEMAATCKAISHGSLMGARGNSGVILSQILRGIAGRCAEDEGDGVGGAAAAEALERAAEAAYQAVMRPVEGTILTVVRAAASGATTAVAAAVDGGGASLVEVLDAARRAGQEALDATPELLPVLAAAGVVDAGGAGFVLLLDAALSVVDGRPVPAPPDAPDDVAGLVATAADGGSGGGGGGSVTDLRYEVMYLLEAPDAAVPAFKEVWAGIGDSIVVVGGEGTWNCHIHTDDIGASIEAAIEIGVPRRIRVTDLLEQVEEERWVREGVGTGEEPEPASVVTAVVAVATGEGIRRIFRSLGVHHVVAGGQSMNPSTAQLLDAVGATGAAEVVILPNNKNIVAVAEQVDALAEATVRVVPTRGIAEGFAALLVYDPDAPAAENAKEMAAAAEAVVAGEVTRAVRDSSCDVGPIATGDWLGISPGGIVSVESSLAGAVIGLLDRLVDADREIVTVIEGEGATAADTRRLTEWLAEHRPGVEVEVHPGGQPLYPYLLGVE